MNLELFHGTNKKQALNIIKNGFNYPGSNAYPGDLGYGIYNFYADKEKLLLPPEIAANRYASKYRSKPIGIVVSDVDFDDDNFLDLDEESNKKKLKIVRNRFVKELIIRKKDYQKKHPKSRAAKRGNIDGFAVEALLRVFNLTPDIIFEEKWEDVDDENVSVGLLPNSKVAVIRNQSIIMKRRMLS